MREFTFLEIWPFMAATVCRVHSAMIDGISNADRMVDLHPELVTDGIMWSQHVRGYLCKELEVQIDDEPFALERGFNLSLTLFSEIAHIRILKAAQDKMPQPGSSLGRIDFFNQRLGQFVLEGMSVGIAEREKLPECAPNFVLKWSVDEFHNLVQLDLGHPKPTIRELFEDVPQEWYWIEPVLEISRPMFQSDQQRLDIEDIPDLEPRDNEDSEGDADQGTGTE